MILDAYVSIIHKCCSMRRLGGSPVPPYAARIMGLYGISSLVVVSEGRIVGIITERDIAHRVVARGLDPERVRVCDVMSHPVIVTYPSTPLGCGGDV